MAARETERLFSLELLVDWVRLEAGSPFAGAGGPAVALFLLDFPPLLVHPPATPVPAPQRGAIGFGRGKACLFRLRPAALRSLLLHAALLQLPAGREPTPRLLGACDVPLAVASLEVAGRRGTFALLSPTGERVGDVALFYRLTELGGSQLGSPEPPAPSAPAAGAEGTAGSQEARGAPHILLKARRPASAPELRPRDGHRPAGAPAARQDRGKRVFLGEAIPGPSDFVKSLRKDCAAARSAGVRGRPVSPPSEDVAELDFETNTFCPPPLYYTHLTQEKKPPARVKITVEPHINVPEELDDAFPKNSLVNSPTQLSPLKYTNSAAEERPTALVSPPHSQDKGAINQTTFSPQNEQNTINTIRQLPLLNALLIELSLLYNQPMASPTQIHPHLAWLYRSQDKVSESYAKSTESESKHQLSVGEDKKSVSLQCKKNAIERLKKDKYSEKSSGNSETRVTRRRLLYGLTNTLRLRLKQTNPDMLIVQEKREHYRKMQAQMLGTKRRITPSKGKSVLNFAEQSQQPQLPKNNYLDEDTSLVENSNTSKQIGEAFDSPSTTKETKAKQGTEQKTIDCGQNRTSNGLVEGIISPANSIITDRFTHTNTLGGKLEKSVQSLCVFQKDAADRSLDKEIGGEQVKTADEDVLATDMSESRPSRNSFCESISELKYSDDFTSPCYSEDFHTIEDTSRSLISLKAHDSSSKAGNPKHDSYTSKSIRKNSSEKSSILSPPFSAGSPVLSQRRSHTSKNKDRRLEETSSISTGDLSSSHSTEEKGDQMDQNSMHNSKVIKTGQAVTVKTGTSWKSLERSQSPRTSQLSSYFPSNLSELELKVLDSSTSNHFGEDDDDIGSLSFSKQCKDICELVINKLPGYTV
ncbi:PREDICTED: microtubule-associated protein 10 [Chinchilla lanigera]|uniref:microtubule-associated protein 10 n=1 Tax=Chinchilla lanigera TaxID=34839 RepID=UPI00038EE59B|nr:PREDICTED: microtubule-associated protein 10 [Chinchilla lanigera]